MQRGTLGKLGSSLLLSVDLGDLQVPKRFPIRFGDRVWIEFEGGAHDIIGWGQFEYVIQIGSAVVLRLVALRQGSSPDQRPSGALRGVSARGLGGLPGAL